MLSSGFSMADVQELSQSYEIHSGDEGETPMSPTPGIVMGSPWSRGGKQGSLTKAKSIDQPSSLTVPSLHEAQKIMKTTGKCSRPQFSRHFFLRKKISKHLFWGFPRSGEKFGKKGKKFNFEP